MCVCVCLCFCVYNVPYLCNLDMVPCLYCKFLLAFVCVCLGVFVSVCAVRICMIVIFSV